MYESASANFIALNKLRGFTLRQQRLLELEAVYRSTQYVGLPPWEQETITDDRGTRPLCGHEREPRLKAGLVEEKVETILDMLVGEGRFPDLDIDGDKELAEKVDKVRLRLRVRGPARDLMVKGSGALAIGVLEGDEIEAQHLRPEWCEPIFVAKVGLLRAREIAEEVRDAFGIGLGVALPAPRDEREFLWTPDKAQSHDLAWLRHEYVYHDEGAESAGAKGKVSWRRRVDYGPTMTVYWEDVQVYEKTDRAPPWKVSEVLYHGWGVVPVAWARTPDAEDGEPEGPSLITEAFRSIAEAADRALTRKDESVGIVSNPKAYTIDLGDLVANINTERGLPSGWRASSAEVLSFESLGEKEGKIGLLEPTGKGPEAAKAHFDDLVAQASRVSRVIAHDPQQVAGVQSGAALERMMEPTIQRVGTYRMAVEDLVERFIAIAARVLGRPAPKVWIQWPPIIRPTASDIQALAQALSTASGGAALISHDTAIRFFAAMAGIEDPDAEVKAVTKEADAALEAARQAMKLRAKAPAKPKDPAVDTPEAP
jgi:hypothetical protein